MVVIKKYANRRLYNTKASSYINQDQLADLIRHGETIQVVDAKTNDDLTHEVLFQLMVDLAGGSDVFPVALLHRIIRTVRLAPEMPAMKAQLSTGLQLLDRQLAQFEQMWSWGRRDSNPSTPEEQPPEAGDDNDDELAALRAKLEELESRLKR
jgi:polyhydroxyalkanoate synthesis repressor PhaR